MLLSEKVIVVTGGASGIGYECVQAYVREGARVAVLDIRPLPDAKISGDPDRQPLWLSCNVTREKEVKEAFEKIAARYGAIHCVLNNAAIAKPTKALHETTDAEWHALMNANLYSIYLTTKYGFPWLERSKGCIINISSLVAEIGQEKHAVYAATKGAVNALTKSMALDYAASGVRVNAVAPAGVMTAMLKEWTLGQPNPESIEKYLSSIHPLGYCPSGDVVADACVFLASEMARFITGCILPVTGGAELGYRLQQ